MKPGILPLLAGAALIVVGGTWVIAASLLPQFHRAWALAAFVSPGVEQIELQNAGRHYLWNDYQSIHEGRSYDHPKRLPNGMEFTIRDASGKELPMATDTSITMTTGNSAKQSIGYVEIENIGTVSVEVKGTAGDGRVFSFSQMNVGQTAKVILKAVAKIAFIALAGLGLIIFGVVRMLNSKQTPPPADGSGAQYS